MLKQPPVLPQLRRRTLRRAIRHIEWLGFTYHGRRHFWAKQAPLLRLYLEDQELSAKALRSIQRFLRATNIVTAADPPLGRCQCRVLGVQLLAPCRYQQCSYWGNYPSLFNCIQAYLSHREAHNLSIAEMAIFSGFSRVMVHNVFTKAMAKLRTAAQGDVRDESFDPQAQLVRIDGVCIVCGTQTPTPPGAVGSSLHPYTYCSFSCWATKRPTVLALEERFGVAAPEVITSLTTRFATLAEAATCMALPSEAIEQLLRAEAPTHPFLAQANVTLRPRLRGHRSWQRHAVELTKLLAQLPVAATPATTAAIPSAVSS